jgi:hypothetical protein
MLTTINTRLEATQRVMATKLTRLTHKIAIQLHLVAESCTICSSRSRRPDRKLPVHILTPYFFKILFNIILPSTSTSPPNFSTKYFYEFPITPKRATCPAHVIVDVITLKMFGDAYKLCRSSLWKFLQLPATCVE